MLKNYFTIAWRHLSKNRAYAVINIAGLATGMAIALRALTETALVPFNTLAGKDMHIPWGNPLFWAAIAVFTIGTGLLAP